MNKIQIIINVLCYGLIVLVLGQYVIKDFETVRYNRPFFILKNINLSYDKKMEMKAGEIPYSFAMFIKNNTQQDSTILIPPQGYPWDKTSNVAYLRYFLYPRNLVNGDEKDSKVSLFYIDYVLIDYGETNVSQYGYTNFWPKFGVNGEYIIYWNPSNGSTKRVDNIKYIYNPNNVTWQWGLIKVKK